MVRSCIFKPGDRVICINARVTDQRCFAIYQNWICEDTVYTVRRVQRQHDGKYGLLLREVVNPKVFDQINEAVFEPGFSEHRFIFENLEERMAEMVAEKQVSLLLEELNFTADA